MKISFSLLYYLLFFNISVLCANNITVEIFYLNKLNTDFIGESEHETSTYYAPKVRQKIELSFPQTVTLEEIKLAVIEKLREKQLEVVREKELEAVKEEPREKQLEEEIITNKKIFVGKSFLTIGDFRDINRRNLISYPARDETLLLSDFTKKAHYSFYFNYYDNHTEIIPVSVPNNVILNIAFLPETDTYKDLKIRIAQALKNDLDKPIELADLQINNKVITTENLSEKVRRIWNPIKANFPQSPSEPSENVVMLTQFIDAVKPKIIQTSDPVMLAKIAQDIKTLEESTPEAPNLFTSSGLKTLLEQRQNEIGKVELPQSSHLPLYLGLASLTAATAAMIMYRFYIKNDLPRDARRLAIMKQRIKQMLANKPILNESAHTKDLIKYKNEITFYENECNKIIRRYSPSERVLLNLKAEKMLIQMTARPPQRRLLVGPPLRQETTPGRPPLRQESS